MGKSQQDQENTPSDRRVSERLDSWKEIAVYLDRNVRTVYRWEKKEDLPVHRHVHDKRGTVYAYPSEIDTWLANRSRVLDKHEPAHGFRFFSENKKAVVGVAGAAVPAETPAKRNYFWLAIVGGPGIIVVLLALFWPFTATAPEGAIDSIAILPFENRSGDPKLGFVSDGIAEGIISRMSQLSNLNKVISSSSVRQYKGKEVDARTVAQEVDVRAVVMGNVTLQGENLRVYVELIDGESNSTLWGKTYTRPRSAVYELEETLSKEIADALGIRLTGEEGERLTRRYTENSEAQEAYLKGRSELAKLTVESVYNAIQYFGEAVQKDPNYARAYAALARSYYRLALLIPNREAMLKTEEMAMKALEIDSTVAEGHAALGDVKRIYYWDWTGADEEYKLAIELDPSSFEAPYGYAFWFTAMGRHDEAIAMIKRAQQLDPLNPATRTGAARIFFFAHRYEEAVKQCQLALEMESDYSTAYLYLADNYGAMGRYREAGEAFQKAGTLLGASEGEFAGLSEAAAAGAEAYIRWRFNYDTQGERGQSFGPADFVRYHALLGEKDQAFEWLEKAFHQEHPPGFGHIKVNPDFDPLRDDPRFQDLLLRMNLEP